MKPKSLFSEKIQDLIYYLKGKYQNLLEGSVKISSMIQSLLFEETFFSLLKSQIMFLETSTLNVVVSILLTF